jgi:ABC-2 type transport system ATP-binding protein
MVVPIECGAVTKRFGDVVAVDHVDLTIGSGSVVGFLGPNAAGKTTLIRMLTGLTTPTSGAVRLFGESPSSRTARRHLGYMPADPSFYPALTGAENLDLLARLGRGGARDRVWAADLLELSSDSLERPVRDYSSGMRQKLGLIQAVQHHPDLVIFDEPANRLDPLAHRHFEVMVRAIAEQGRTVFLSSHTLSEVQDVCDEVAMIRAGRLIARRAVAELAAAEPRHLKATYSDRPRVIPAGLVETKITGNMLEAQVPSGRIDLVRALLEDPTIQDLTIEPASLEDAFVELYEERAA